MNWRFITKNPPTLDVGSVKGTIEEFIETVNSKYKDTKYFKEYTLALDLMKLKLNNN